jgi:hypothetical protein
MIRYWIQFKLPIPRKYPMGVSRGCGVTAYSREDAMEMMREAIFSGDELPEVEYITENVDVSTLDAGHVLPNMGNSVVRGIWFPSGFVVAA